MKSVTNITTIVIFALAVPIAALANVTGTPTLSSGQTLSLDTGAVATSGGDILWTGSSITLQGSATAANLGAFGFSGMSQFSILSQTILSAFPASLYSSAAIPASALAVGNIVAIRTNGGNSAAFIVTAQSGTSITLQFITFASAVPTGPVISQILNNYGLIPSGFTNSGIALGSLFIIKGSGLASATTVTSLQSSASPGLPNTLNGASVKVTVNGTTTVPVFYYAIASQLALVMPSSTPTGNGTVTVTYNGATSAPFSIQVVASAMGFDAYYGTGGGLGVATNPATGALYNYSNSIPPGTTVTMWGSGLGADPPRDTTFNGSVVPINGLSAMYVGGVQATVTYQGGSGYPGLNQVNVTIPANAPTGCNVSVVGVSTAGVPTNFLTLPIGSGICQDPGLGTNGTQLTSLSGQTTVNSGVVALESFTSPATSGTGTQTLNIASAEFESYTGSTYGSASGIVSIGGCIVIENLTSGSVGSTTGLNAGTISVTGPNGSATLTSESGVLASLAGFYEAQLPAGFITSSGGTFTYQSTGGTTAPIVGPFTAQIVFPNPLLTWTNQAADATVTRSAGVLVTWTGGSGGTYVVISGSSSSGSVSGSFTCLAPVSALQFTVPPYVLAALPASNNGSLVVENETVPQTFNATGLNYGYAAGIVGYDITAAYK